MDFKFRDEIELTRPSNERAVQEGIDAMFGNSICNSSCIATYILGTEIVVIVCSLHSRKTLFCD